jgi:hypothetical protein
MALKSRSICLGDNIDHNSILESLFAAAHLRFNWRPPPCRRRNAMFKNQQLTRFRSSLVIAALAVGLVAGTSLPAAASLRGPTQPGWAGREYVRIHGDIKYAPVQPELTHVRGVPPDYCDLPSAGCESYLSN